jgi:hypothetical protein
MDKEAELIMELDLQLYSVRTDLALEAKEMAQGPQKTPIPGVNEEVEEADIKVTVLPSRIVRLAGHWSRQRKHVTLEVPGTARRHRSQRRYPWFCWNLNVHGQSVGMSVLIVTGNWTASDTGTARCGEFMVTPVLPAGSRSGLPGYRKVGA